jgi:CDGSH-type Zn-finger protein
MSASMDPVSLTIGLGVGMVLMAAIRRFGPDEKKGQCNPGIMKDQPKVATMCKIKDIEELLQNKAAVTYCRCWRSSTFPFCDGTHVKFNAESGDNVGPLVVKKE